MISEKMKPFMANNSAIRAMFEEGKRMAAIYGKENVYDFSLGNPNVPVPQVTEAILDVVKNEDFMTLHGYMSNAGFEDVRQTIADSLNKRFGTNFSFKNLIMAVGAASGLNIILKSILNVSECRPESIRFFRAGRQEVSPANVLGWYPAATGSRAGPKFRAVRRESFLMACQVSAS